MPGDSQAKAWAFRAHSRVNTEEVLRFLGKAGVTDVSGKDIQRSRNKPIKIAADALDDRLRRVAKKYGKLELVSESA